MKTLGIIPARFGSTRFPGKPMVDINGKTMIERVYNQASKSKSLSEVIVATDDKRILNHVQDFGGKAVLTSALHKTGTERCAEVASKLKNQFDLVINIQGDEPFIQPAQIDSLAGFMEHNPNMNIGTLAMEINEQDSIFNPNHIKVVFAKDGLALYFSRSPIPFVRGAEQKNWLSGHQFYKHIGMYGYRLKSLLEIADLQESQLESAESLEQLRWMEHGYTIGVKVSELKSPSIDTPEDLEQLLKSINISE